MTQLVYDFEMGVPVGPRMLAVIKEWFSVHAGSSDRRLAEYLAELPETAKPRCATGPGPSMSTLIAT